jgi:hypothetical protein
MVAQRRFTLPPLCWDCGSSSSPTTVSGRPLPASSRRAGRSNSLPLAQAVSSPEPSLSLRERLASGDPTRLGPAQANRPHGQTARRQIFQTVETPPDPGQMGSTKPDLPEQPCVCVRANDRVTPGTPLRLRTLVRSADPLRRIPHPAGQKSPDRGSVVNDG